MKYNYQISSHHKRKYVRRAYIFLAIVILAGLIVAAIIKLDAYMQKNQNNPADTTTDKTTAYFAPKTKIFRTQYFQFQTDDSWVELPAESNGTQYVYRSIRNNLIEHELIIYVVYIPDNLDATRVLPVSIKPDKQLSVNQVSDHCRTILGSQNLNQAEVSFHGVTMNCDVDDTQFDVLVGLMGGTTKLTLARPNGDSTAYAMYYRNVTASPEAIKLSQIVSSFQTR